MSRYQNGSIVKLKRKSGQQVWVFRWYQYRSGGRKYCKKVLGTLADLPTRKDAEKAAAPLRIDINSEIGSPQTRADLTDHYQKHELVPERKAFASIETHKGMTARYLIPQWGAHRLTDVRTVQVEEWLKSLPLAPASKTKLKYTFSVLYSHAIRHEWTMFNPICKVRTSCKPLREKDVLTPDEFAALLDQLSVRDRAMVMLAGSTGLRRSEFIGLTWADVNEQTMEISITRSCVRGRFGETKTEASRRPVPLHSAVLDALAAWRNESLYTGRTDFLFPSVLANGTKPMSPDTLLKKMIRPAVQRAGIKNKIIGWHSFRHSLATNLRALGVDVKVAQELLRHVNSRTTLDIYTRAVSAQKREASAKVMDLFKSRVKEGESRENSL